MAVQEQLVVADVGVPYRSSLGSVRSIVRLLRPHQWLKNAAVLLVPFLTLGIQQGNLLRCATAVAAFCLTSSAVYVLNDYLDVERDRLHPTKRERPLPSGAVSKAAALGILGALAIGGIVLGSISGLGVLIILGIYVIVNVAYCLKLKHLPIFDLLCVSSGFVLRVMAGAVAINAVASPSLLGAVAAASFALVVAKRRTELVRHSEAETQRPALAGYDVKSLDQSLAASGIAAALLYFASITSGLVVSKVHSNLGSGLLALTLLTALSALLRLLHIIHDSKAASAEDPARMIVRDRLLRSIIVFAGALTLANTVMNNMVAST